MAGGRFWTKEEDLFLEDYVGFRNIASMAKSLGRTEIAVRGRLETLGISKTMQMTGKLTANELSKAVNVDSHVVLRWINEHGLRAVTRATRTTAKFHFIDIQDFWKWAEQNKDKIIFSRIEENVLLPEPDWVKEARRIDAATIPKKKNVRWTTEEDKRLIELVKQEIPIDEIAQRLDRSDKAVQRRISKLRAKRMLPAKKVVLKWSKEETQMMLELERKGLSDEEIAIEMGRSEKNISWKRTQLRKKGLYKGMKGRVKKCV